MFEGFLAHVSLVALSNIPEQCIILLDILVFREGQQDCLKHWCEFQSRIEKAVRFSYYRDYWNQICSLKEWVEPRSQVWRMQNEGYIKCNIIFYPCLLQTHKTKWSTCNKNDVAWEHCALSVSQAAYRNLSRLRVQQWKNAFERGNSSPQVISDQSRRALCLCPEAQGRKPGLQTPS